MSAKFSAQSGFILPTALFAVALLALSAATLATLIYDTIHSRRVSSHALVRSLADRQALLQTLQSPSAPSQRVSCVPAALVLGRAPPHLCSHRALRALSALPVVIDGRTLQHPEDFPLVDPSELFASPTNCLASNVHRTSRTTSGFHLTPSAVRSFNTCRVQQPLPSDARFQSNIEAAGALTLPSAPQQTVTATGYIDIDQPLVVSAPIRIMAGGDLRIATITQGTAASADITVVSLTGAVLIEQVVGTVRLQAVGWQGVYLPGNAQTVRLPATLPLQTQDILGVTYDR